VFDALITTEKLDIIVENYELGNSFKCNYWLRFIYIMIMIGKTFFSRKMIGKT
jgi:hypothetical protein